MNQKNILNKDKEQIKQTIDGRITSESAIDRCSIDDSVFTALVANEIFVELTAQLAACLNLPIQEFGYR